MIVHESTCHQWSFQVNVRVLSHEPFFKILLRARGSKVRAYKKVTDLASYKKLAHQILHLGGAFD